MKHNFKKKYGQNFIQNNEIIDHIMSNVDLNEESLVIEIGPGKGVLTNKIIKTGAKVIAYEIDTDLQDYLSKAFNNIKNVKFIWEDFLQRNIKDDIASSKFTGVNYYVIANIPYYITTPIIMKLLDSSIPFKKIVLMVQKEVGERLSTVPGNKEYGSITAFLNYYYNIEKLFDVGKENFYPQPNVDSVVIQFEQKSKRNIAQNEEKLFQLIRDAFKYKRKTLKNNLNGYDFEKIMLLLSAKGYCENVRAESLSIDDFVEIINNI